MKITCLAKELRAAVQVVSRATTRETKNDVVTNKILFVANEDGTLTLTGYNGSFGIKKTIAVDVLEAGAAALDRSLLSSILSKASDNEVSIDVSEKHLAVVKSGKAKFDLSGADPALYPILPTVDASDKLNIPQKQLKAMLKSSVYAVSENEAKPIHTGCLFRINENTLNVVAVDGYRLALQAVNLAGPISFDCVVPGTALRELGAALQDTEETMSICYTYRFIQFESENTTLISNLISGEFLNYNQAIPTQVDYTVTVNKNAFKECIERVGLIANDKLRNPVVFEFSKGKRKVAVSCRTTIGSSYDECDIEGDIEDLTIGFNKSYLLEALNAIDDERVCLQMNGSLKPLLITPVDGEAYKHLVLPVRLKGD